MASLVGGITSAVVMASMPDGNGVIHACYTKGSSAKTRIIDTANQSCNGNETAISWNQQGPTGPQGPQGLAGSGSSSPGHALLLNWGDIPENGTSQPLFTIPGFGDVSVDQCDSDGITKLSFHNTSGQTVTTHGGTDILPGATISTTAGNLSHFLVIGNGQNSHIAVLITRALSVADTQTCSFFGSTYANN